MNASAHAVRRGGAVPVWPALLVLLVLLWPLAARALDPPAPPAPVDGEAPAGVASDEPAGLEDEEEPPVPVAAAGRRFYDVEVIVFLQRHDDLQPEFWRTDRRLPRHAPEAALMQGVAPSAAVFRELHRNERRLDGLAQRLEQGAAYQVLAHLAWRQPAVGGGAAAAVSLPTGLLVQRPALPVGEALEWAAEDADAPDDGVQLITGSLEPQGYLRVWVERFIHVEASLRVPAPTGHPAVAPALRGEAVVFDLDVSRRLSAGRLHYIDHPALGMLVRVDRVDGQP
jgi:hypothetical protein